MYSKPGSRQDWSNHFERRQRREKWLIRFLVIGYLALTIGGILWALPALADCDGLSLDIGIGAHDPAIDGPEYTTRNALGIIEARYQAGPWAGVLSHTSSLEGWPAVWNSEHEHGYGANVLSVRYTFGPWQ